jgi:hypothetical protein
VPERKAAAVLQLTREETESSATRGASVKLQHGDEHLQRGRKEMSVAASYDRRRDNFTGEGRSTVGRRGSVALGHAWSGGGRVAAASVQRCRNGHDAVGAFMPLTNGPHTSALFQFQKTSKITFPHKRNRYTVRKNLRKFLRV